MLVEDHGAIIFEPGKSAKNNHTAENNHRVPVATEGGPLPFGGGGNANSKAKGLDPISNREMGPSSSQLMEHMFDDVHFSLPVPDGVEKPDGGPPDGGNKRSLQSGQVTTWVCANKSNDSREGVARIWWGHNEGDALWACDNWVGACSGGRCKVYLVTKSEWNCYRKSDNRFIDRVQIWWGHNVGDGTWACNSWLSACGNGGGCMVTGGAWDDCNTWRTTDGCSAGLEPCRSALKQACDQHDYCYNGPVSEGFQQGYRACNYLFINRAKEVGVCVGDAQAWFNGMMLDSLNTLGSISGGGLGDAYQNQQLDTEKRCYLGRSVPYNGYTTPCWGTNTRCFATACVNCCNGYRWVWEWAGDHCN